MDITRKVSLRMRLTIAERNVPSVFVVIFGIIRIVSAWEKISFFGRFMLVGQKKSGMVGEERNMRFRRIAAVPIHFTSILYVQEMPLAERLGLLKEK